MTDLRALRPALDRLAGTGIFVGTSSWKYPGWIGQLYTPERYLYRERIAKSRFEKECLSEYAEVFPSVCLDSSFYRFPSQEYLQRLADQVPEGFRFSHKVTDTITIKRFPKQRRHGDHAGKSNPCYLDHKIFLQSFLKPLRSCQGQTGIIMFEFSRFYKRDYARGRDFVRDLDRFLSQLPTREWDFGVEVRNQGLLQEEYFDTLARHGVGHVYNQWQRMPPLESQLKTRAPDRNTAPVGSRLLLKCGHDYRNAVESFAPYDRIQEPQPETRHAAATLIRALQQNPSGRRGYLYVNNRLEGNALATVEAILQLLESEAL